MPDLKRNRVYNSRVYKSHRSYKNPRTYKSTRTYKSPRTYKSSNNKAITLKLLRFYSVLLMITLTITGITLNRLELDLIIQDVKAEGIDYDAFREMMIPVNLIKTVKDKYSKELTRKEVTNEEHTSKEPNPADYITVSMLLNEYNLKNAKTLRKSNMNYLIKNLSQNPSFTELSRYYKAILADIKCYPVIPDKVGKLNITFTDTWNEYRSYGGNRRHEGTDLMSAENIRGDYPVVSMTDGTVEKKGWLEQGGYRIGIRGTYGAYFYYAHLESYAPELQVGDTIKAGQLLGYMGDSGYGSEGTVGKFDVHLHVGIYVETDFGELSVNPYLVLRYLETLK